jgi:CheY-like chemotaxis protein
MLLLVDDSPDIRFTFATVLRRDGWEVETADSGEDALALFDPARHDVLVVDYSMPGMDGLELIARLHERPDAVPVVLFSAYLDDTVAAQAKELGAAVVAKSDYARLPKALRELAGDG